MTFFKFQLEYFSKQAELHATLDHCAQYEKQKKVQAIAGYWPDLVRYRRLSRPHPPHPPPGRSRDRRGFQHHRHPPHPRGSPAHQMIKKYNIHVWDFLLFFILFANSISSSCV